MVLKMFAWSAWLALTLMATATMGIVGLIGGLVWAYAMKKHMEL